MSASLFFTAESWEVLKSLSEQAYPFEGCGLLLGPIQEKKTVQKIVLLYNTLRDQGRGRFDFMFSPQEFVEKQMQADREGLDVIGIFHTHPDHPPKPSPTDASQPMLSGWINVISSVHGGTFKDAKAWLRLEESDPFEEIPLYVEPKT